MIWLEKMHTTERNGGNEIKQKLQTLVSHDNGIKTDIFAIVVVVVL